MQVNTGTTRALSSSLDWINKGQAALVQASDAGTVRDEGPPLFNPRVDRDVWDAFVGHFNEAGNAFKNASIEARAGALTLLRDHPGVDPTKAAAAMVNLVDDTWTLTKAKNDSFKAGRTGEQWAWPKQDDLNAAKDHISEALSLLQG